VIAILPKIAASIIPAEVAGTGSVAESTAPVKSFSGVLQEATQNYVGRSGAEEDSTASSQLDSHYSNAGHENSDSEEFDRSAEQRDEVKSDSQSKSTRSHHASLTETAAHPQLTDRENVKGPSTKGALDTATAVPTQDAEKNLNTEAVQWRGIAVDSLPSGLGFSYVQSATLPDPIVHTQSAAPLSSAAAGSVAAMPVQNSAGSPNAAEVGPIDLVPSAPSQQASLSAAGNESLGNANIGSTIGPHLQIPDNDASTTAPATTVTVAPATAMPATIATVTRAVFAKPVPVSNGKPGPDLTLPSSTNQSTATVAKTGTPAPATEAGLSMKEPVPATANVSKLTHDAIADLKPAENAVPAENVTRIGSHHFAPNDLASDNHLTSGAQTTSSATAMASLPLSGLANNPTNTQLSVGGANTASNSGTTETAAVSGTQPTAATSDKDSDAGGSGNPQSSTNQTSETFSVGMMVSGQTGTNDIGAGVRQSDVMPTGISSAPVQVSSGGSGNETSAQVKANGHAAASPNSESETENDVPTSSPTSQLHSAKLVERLGQAELRVGVHTEQFGNVDIRTSMVRNQFSAQISVERPELGKILAAELPNLQNRLSEQRVPAANITLENQASGGSAGFGQGSRQSHTTQQIVVPNNLETEPVLAAVVSPETSHATTRLDVHM
jgi:hypothetical protein